MDMTKAEFLASVITDTIDSGATNYWSEHKGYHWEFKSLGGRQDWAEVQVRDAEAGEKTWHPVTLGAVDDAFKKLAMGRVMGLNEADRGQMLAAYFTDGEGADFDALMGDCIFQVILFGEVKYG